MWKDIFSSTKSLGTNAMSFLLKSVKSRQVGSNEAADRLLGHKLYSKSQQIRFADLHPADKVKCILKRAADIKNILDHKPQSTDIFMLHWVLDVIPNHPDSMESMSLFELLSWYEKQKKETEFKLKNMEIFLGRRKDKPYIVTHQIINPNTSEETKQSYFFYLLKLFKPWRMESYLLPPGQTYAKHFTDISSQYPEMVTYHKWHVRFEEKAEELDKAIQERAKETAEVVEPTDEDDCQNALQGCIVDQVQTAMDEVQQVRRLTMQRCTSAETELDTAYNSLNIDQKRIVDNVVSAVCEHDSTIHLFVSGQRGTGKSRVIDILNQTISSKFPANTVRVTVSAPTGLAAFNIAGTTIHRLLCLPIEHGKPPNYSRLNQDNLTVIRKTLHGLKLLIIDEVSTVSSLTLQYIHLRLTEVTSNQQLFGGVSVVLFADLLQLPPIKGNAPFQHVTFFEAKQRIGSIASIDLWKNFQYQELTINMRQNGDECYAELLARVRVGQVSDEAEELLRQRMIHTDRRATTDEIVTTYNNLCNNNQSPIILVPHTALCQEINNAVLTKMNKEIQNLSAIDTLDSIVESRSMTKVVKEYEKIKSDVTRTAGLEQSLRLCVGAKVMLKRNKNVEAGLVNGSAGIVVDFVRGETEVTSIKVRFEATDSVVSIERESCSFEVLKGIYYTRKQYPIIPAFAITIHKSQGLSLKSAVIDAGSACFRPGMVYVALSRVTSIVGVHLIDLDKMRIRCNMSAVKEYNRLRRLYTPHLGDLAAVQPTRKRKSSTDMESVEGKAVSHSRTQTSPEISCWQEEK